MSNTNNKIQVFEEPEALNGVSKFHHLFDLPVLNNPHIPDAKRCELRVSLLQEELNELQEAIDEQDIVGIADALSDLQYVLSGAVLEFGLGHTFKQLFDEVQRSNMSKACLTMEEALETQAYYLEHKNTESFIQEKDGEFLVYRKADKKVLKNINYSEANLKVIIDKNIPA